MCPSDLLLLDEPTNHLDLDAIIWLEEWLRRYPGTLLIVSHDRDFLDAVVTAVVHIDQKKLRRYSGNYSSFEEQRAQNLVLAQSQIEKQQRERAHLQSFIDRFKAKATKARQAQSRMKMLAKMEHLAPLHVAAPFSFEFREPLRAPNPLLVLEDVRRRLRRQGGPQDINLSTAVRSSASACSASTAPANRRSSRRSPARLPPLGGGAVFNKGLEIGYFAQHQVEMLRDDQSPLWHLAASRSELRASRSCATISAASTSPATWRPSSIEHFSGGEKARLALALIVWQRPNLLLLDEPTNHLDLETREALTVALAQFEGTLVLVSHDRHLLRATTEQLLIVADGAVKPFDGDLDDYRESLLEPQAPNRRRNRCRNSPRPKPIARKPIEARIKRLEELMAKLNAQKADIDARLAEPALYRGRGRAEGAAPRPGLCRQGARRLESEWLAKQAELESGAA